MWFALGKSAAEGIASSSQIVVVAFSSRWWTGRILHDAGGSQMTRFGTERVQHAVQSAERGEEKVAVNAA
jgi:hypothetical protein